MKFFILIILFSLLLTNCSTIEKSDYLSRNLSSKITSAPKLPQDIQRLIDFEQTKIDRTVDANKIYPPDIEGQKIIYRPENQNWYEVKTYWVPENELYQCEISNSPLSGLFRKTINGKKYYRLIVHPESEKFYANHLDNALRAEDMLATSTSSSRTVLIKSHTGQFFFGKLSLDVELGGVVRTIPRGEVSRSIGTTIFTDNAIAKNEVSPFKYIREVFGIIPIKLDRGGMIIREIPSLPDGHALMPLFSIYAKTNGEKSVLHNWIQHSLDKGEDPKVFIKEKLLRPFAKGWVDSLITSGLVMEAHAQNVLIEVDQNNMPLSRFYHRDNGGFNIDLTQFEKEKWYKQLPFFTSISEDYHQQFHEKAILQSLETYFEGGFLFNLNNEYKLVTHDEETDFIYTFRSVLVEELQLKLGKKSRLNPNNSNFYSKFIKIVSEPKSCFDFIKKFFD